MRNRILVICIFILALTLSGCQLFDGLMNGDSAGHINDSGDDVFGESGGELLLGDDAVVFFDEDDLSEAVEVSLDKTGSRKFSDHLNGYAIVGSKVELTLASDSVVDDSFELRLKVDEGNSDAAVLFVSLDGESEWLHGEQDDDFIVVEVERSGYYAAVITETPSLIDESMSEEGMTDESDAENEESTSDGEDDDIIDVEETNADATDVEGNDDVTEEGSETSETVDETAGETSGTPDVLENLVDTTAKTNEMLGGRVILAKDGEVFEYKPESHTLSSLFATDEGYSLIDGGLNPTYPVACYASDGNAEGLLTMVNLSQGGFREVAVDGASRFTLAWSPDGGMLAIGTEASLYIYKFNEKTLHKMEDGYIESMAWTSNSDALLYSINGNTLKIKRIGGTTDVLVENDSAESLVIMNRNGASTKNTFYVVGSLDDGSSISYTYEYTSNALIVVDTYEELNDAYYIDVGVSKTLIALAGGSMNTDFPEILPSQNQNAKWILSDGYLGAIFNNDIAQNVWIGWCKEAVIAAW